MSLLRAPLLRPTDEAHRVTTLELFFDLVFVFAITQVTAVMSNELGARGALRGLVLLALLWWVWCSYAWLGNTVRADVGLLRATMVLATGATFVVALCIPQAWSEGAGSLPALATAVSLAFVRGLHLAVYLVVARGAHDAGLRHQLVVTAAPVGVAAALLVVGAVLGGPGQTVFWLLSLVVDYVGVYAAGTSGWRLPAPVHFAERHGLIVIIALGESIVSIGVGASGLPITPALLVAASLGLAVTVALWWTYFDVAAIVAERALAAREGTERARLGRDSFTYLHFLMVAGIIYLALGLKKVVEYAGNTAHHDLTDALPPAAGLSLYGGVVAYLLAHAAFRRRNIGSFNRQRIAVGVLLVALAALTTRMPAIASLAVLAAVLTALVSYEFVRFASWRQQVRTPHVAP